MLALFCQSYYLTDALVATGVLSQEQQERLQALYEQTNPLRLREEIYAGLAVPFWDRALSQNGKAA
jgi:hypothetical protein